VCLVGTLNGRKREMLMSDLLQRGVDFLLHREIKIFRQYVKVEWLSNAFETVTVFVADT
jgi:hypothetical protein